MSFIVSSRTYVRDIIRDLYFISTLSTDEMTCCSQ